MLEKKQLNNIHALEKELLVTRIELRREQLNYRAKSLSRGLKEKLKDTGKTLALPAVASLVIPGAICLATRGRIKPARAARIGLITVQLLNSALPLLLTHIKNTQR